MARFWKISLSFSIVSYLFLSSSVFAEPFTATGVVHPRAEVTMRSKVHGEIRHILVKEGQWVKKGELLMQFDNDREVAMLELAEARLQQARASLEETEVMLVNSRKDFKRRQEASQVVPRKIVEDAEDLVRQHEAAVAARVAEITQSEAQIKLRKAELEDTFVYAPFDGVVTRLIVEEGEVVKALEVDICQVVALDKLYVEASLPEGVFRKIRFQGPAQVLVNGVAGSPPKKLKGFVSYVSPVIDPASKTFRVKVLINSPNGILRPGMTAQMIFP